MPEISICMPTIKSAEQVQDRIEEIKQTASGNYELIVVNNANGGVAENRNACLKQAKGEYIIFVDDDLFNYIPGWDTHLINTLKGDHNCLMAGMRLKNADGSIQNTVSKCSDIHTDRVKVNWLPGANMVYRNQGMLFNEEYKKWSPEDIEFEHILKKQNPGKYFLLLNCLPITHKNEMKNMNEFGVQGKQLFFQRWGFLVE